MALQWIPAYTWFAHMA